MPRYSSAIQIPNLPAAIALNGQEQLEAVQAGTSVRVTSQQIAGLAFGSLAEVTPGTVLGRFSDSAVGPAEELPISVNSDGEVFIGSEIPSGSLLNVVGSDVVGNYDGAIEVFGADYPYIHLDSNADVDYGGAYEVFKARGTRAAPAIVQNGDGLGSVTFIGFDGLVQRVAANIDAVVNGVPGAGDMPGALRFFTTPDGSATFTERMRITSAGNVGIGTSTPYTAFQVNPSAVSGGRFNVESYDSNSGGSNRNTIISTSNFNNDGYGDFCYGAYARGTSSSPAIVQSGDGLSYFAGIGYNGTNYTNAGWIGIEVDGTPGAADMPGRITFITTSDGSTSPVERMRITSAGRVGIGTSAPDASSILDVTSTTGGILFPRMTTTQRDAISSPANGLVVYNTTDSKLQVRAGGSWVDLH